MKKNILLFLSLCTISALSVVLFSCGDDDPPAKAKLSFTTATTTVVESDGTVEIEISLNKAAPEDFTIEYTLKGTAGEINAVEDDEAYDYEDLNEGEIEIKKGDKTAIIELRIYSDIYLEDPETIEISITSVDSEKIEITRADEFEVTLDQEDGMIITLAWPAPVGAQQADMDMFVRVGETTSTLENIFTGSVNPSFQSGELVFIPYAFDDAAFGASYTYYEGTLDPLNFTVRFIDLVNGQLEAEGSRQTFTGIYTLDNINAWTDPYTSQVVQTFKKSGSSFVEIQQPITIPQTGSRISVSSGKTAIKFARHKATVRPKSKLYELVSKLK